MYDVVHPTRRATMLGLANMIGWFGAGCGTYGFGLATARWDISMGQALVSTAVIYAIVAVLLFFAGIVTAGRDVRRSAATPEAAEVIADYERVDLIRTNGICIKVARTIGRFANGRRSPSRVCPSKAG